MVMYDMHSWRKVWHTKKGETNNYGTAVATILEGQTFAVRKIVCLYSFLVFLLFLIVQLLYGLVVWRNSVLLAKCKPNLVLSSLIYVKSWPTTTDVSLFL